MRARTDCCGAYGPLATLTLGSPCWRPNRLRRFVELALSSVRGSNCGNTGSVAICVNIAVVALATNNARIAWAILAHNTEYRPSGPEVVAA